MIDENPGTMRLSQEAPSISAKPTAMRSAIGVALIVAIVIISFWLALNPQYVQRMGQWGYVGAFVISMVASATVVLPAPGLAIVIAMGTSLDPVILGIVAGLGSAFGELTGYAAGAGGRVFVPSAQRAQVERLHALTDRYGALLLAGLAAIPFPLFDFAGIVAGMLRMNIFLFVLAIAIGKSIKYVLLIWAGMGPIQFLQNLLAS